eukprot:CAMPEP_0118905834 /NCGR_PEP_ID=MMETSP1166-20130328/9645_1 /TAXON_ID=1104430 /ORGANISM="Chrysoreinhardia sp, Strain CCMP3193" /LENGTH=290 /DNA_ID=CAMNT_0006845105 /DNA_START=9 /DNA_END=881 /DNA_ORIENTATION=+
MDSNPFDDPSVQGQDSGAPSWIGESSQSSFEMSSRTDYSASDAWDGGDSSWNQPSQQQPAYAAATAPPPPPAAYGGDPRLANGMAQSRAPPEKDNLITYMRLLNMLVTLLMAIAAVTRLMVFPGFNSAILAMYIWFFAMMMCCFETHLKMVSKIIASNFGFLYHVKGRVAFLVLMGMLCMGLNTMGLVAGMACILAAVFNAYVICKHPEYEQKMMAQDMEQRGPGGPADIFAAGADSGANWAAQNPDKAANAATYVVDSNPDLARQAAHHAAPQQDGWDDGWGGSNNNYV